MKNIYSNNNSKRFNILILNLILILFFFFESVHAQNLPFYNKVESDSIKPIKEKEDLNEKGSNELLTVPEKYRLHPEYGKTKLVNPDRQSSYELIQERTVDSRLFQNTDGSFTAVKSGSPLHYKDADGWWRTIDVTFKEDAVTPDLFHLNKQRLPISFDGKTSVVTMQLDSLNSMTYGNDLSFIQIDNNGNMLSNKSINNVVASVDLNKPKASVSNIFDGIDMSFAFDSWMTKTNYVLSARSLINNNAEWVIFREKVNIPENWTLEYDKENGTLIAGNFHGDVLIKNTDGETMSKFQMPVYFDAGHDRNTNNITGSYKIEKIDNKTYYLSLMVPASWLLSPQRAYPVTLDPAINDDPTIIASCLNSYQASNLSVGVSVGYLITNTYLLWEFTAVNNGAWMQDQQSYVSGVGGSTSVFYGSGAMAGTEQYAVNSTIGNGTSTGSANFTFYSLRVWGGSACDNAYNYLNRRYIEVSYYASSCNNFNNFHSNVNGTGYAPCGSFAVTSTIGPGQYQSHYAYLGSSYTINTCGTSWDTQISGFQGGSAVLYYNDDNSLCTANGLNSWIDWTSPVNGWVQIEVTKYNCQSWAAGATSAILRVMENPPATPGTPTLSPAGGTYCSGAYVFIDAVGNPPTGVTWYWQTTPAGTSTLNGGPTYVVSSTGTYYLRPRSSSGCWGTASAGVTATFYPGVSNNTISANQTICSGTSPSTIVGSAPSGGLGAGTYSYGWEISTDGGFTWAYAPAPNTDINYSPTGLTTTTYYKRWVLSGPCNASASNIVVITVQPVIDPGVISANQNICYNTTPSGLTGSPPSGGTGSYAYMWQQQPGCSGGWTDVSTAFNYNPSNLTQTTCYRRRVSSGVCPDVYSNTVTISVYSDLAPGSVISDQVICYNSIPSAFSESSAPSGGTGSYSYQWQLQPGCSGGWADVSGANSNTLSYGSPLFQTTCFRRRVISGACNPVYSNTITVTVYGDVTPGTIASNQSICFNTAPATLTNVALPSGGNGSYLYQWQQQSLCSGGWGDIGGATSITYTSAVNLIQTTCFRRRVVNACGTVYSNVVTVTLYAQFIGGSVGSDQNIPNNTVPAAFTNLSSPTGGTGAMSYQWQQQPGCSGAWSDIGGATAITYSYPGNLTQNTCFRRVATNGCGSVFSNTITVSVQGPVTSGTIGSDQTICYNSTPSQFNNIISPTGGSGSYTYQWQIQPGCSGAWSDIGGATGNVYTQSTPLTQNTCFRRVATSSGQSATSNTVTVLIYANLTSGSVGSDQVICYNSTPSTFVQISAPTGGTGGYSYQWQSQPGCSGGWGDISGATNSAYQEVNLTLTTCYRRNVTSGSCGTVTSNTITVSVNANLTSGSIGNDQAICYNTSPAAFIQTVAPSGGTGSYTYQWLIQPGCTGFYSFIPGATSPTYDEPGNLTQNTCYRRTVTSGSCGQATANTITVTVYAALTSGSVAADQTICYNTVPAQFSSTGNPGGGTGSYTYQWQIQPACSGGWSDISGATSNIYSHPAALSQTTCFRRNATSGSCGTVSSNTITVTVYANLTSGSVGFNQTLCYNTPPAALIQTVAPTGGTGSYAYQWQSQPGCSGGWGDIAGETATTYQAASLTQTTCYRRNVTSGSCGTVSSNTVTITVYGNLTPGSVGSDQTLCYNTSPAAFTQISPSGGTGLYTYQWQIQPGCSGGWSDISGATASTYDDPFNITQTTCYRRNVTSGFCGTVTTNIITVTVYANLTSGSVAADQTICYNIVPATFSNTVSPSGGNGSYTYQWQIQPGCSGAWSDISGATSNIYSSTALTQTTCFRRNVTSGSCGTLSSNTITVTVYGNLTSGAVGSDQTICYNTIPAAFTQTVAPSGGTGSYTYQWQSQPGCSGGWGDIAGATANTYQAGALIQTTCYRRNVTSNSCGTVTTNVITVNVYANLTPGSVGSDQSLCYNTSPAAFVQTAVASGGTGFYTYQWQKQPGCSGAWSDIAGATATTYDDPGNLTQTTCYRRNVTSGSCGTVSTNIITVTVYGDLAGGTVAASQTICYNQNIAGFTNATSPSGGTGFYNYQWQIQPGCSGAWSDIAGANSNIYTHPTTLLQTTCFRRQVINPCGTVYSNTITITVNPLPIVSFTGLAGPYCISQTTPVPLTGSPSGGTFSGNGITGDFFIPYYAAVGSNTITYTYTNGNFCTNSTSQNVVVIGLPTVDFTGLAGPYCVDNSNPVALTGYPAGGTYSGAGISGNTFIPSLAGVGVHTITYTYSDANGCTNTKSYTAVVNALPAVTFSGLQVDYCINTSISTLIGFPSGGTFSGAGISGNTFNATNAGVGPHIITYTYTDAIGCVNFTQQTTTVHNLPTVSFSGLSANYCYEASSALLTGSPSGGIFSGNGISGSYFFPIIAGQGTFNITYTYSDGFSCINSSTQSTNVYGLLTPGTVGNNQTICYNTTPATFVNIAASTGGAPGTTYQWQQQPGCIGVWSNIAGATAITCNFAGNLIQTTCFRRLALNACGSVISNTIEVYVYADLTSGSVAADQTICYNTSPAAFTQTTAPTGGNGTYTYQWQQQPGCSGAWSDIAGATATTYDAPGNITQTTCYRRKVVSGASCGTVYTNIITVTVYGNLTPGSVAADQIICYNTIPASFTSTAQPTGGTGIYSYQWQIQPGCSGAWSDIPGATSDVFAQATPLIQTTCFRRRVISGTCGTVYSNTVTVTVYADLTSGAVVANQTICYNTSPAAFSQSTAPTGGNGTYTYQWQQQPGCIGGWGDIAGATASTYDVPGNLTQTTCYRREVTSGTCGTVITNTITVTVYADLTSGSVAADQTICYNTSPAAFTETTASTGGNGTYTYQWQEQPGCSGAWSDIAGATATTYDVPGNITQTTCYRRKVVSGASCGTVYTNIITVTVNGNLTPGSIAADQTICFNTTPATFTNTTSPTGGTGTYAYQWQIQPGCSGVWTDISGATSNVYTQTTPLIQTTCYRRQITSGTCGTVYSNTITVTVYADLTSGVVATDQTICYNTSPAAFTQTTAATGGNGSYNYQWQQQPLCTGSWSNIAGAIVFTYDVPGNITQTTCYRRQITSGTCGTLYSNIITVTVYPDLTPGTVGYNQSICYDSIPQPFLNISVATGGSGIFTYQWQIQPGCSGAWSNIIGATSTTYAQPTSLTQSTCFRRVVVNTCGTLNSNTITVNVFSYTPVSFTGLQLQYCTDAAPALLTGTPSGGTFSGAGITGNYFYANIAGSGIHTITYTYIDPNGCMNFQTQQVTVYDIPILSFTGLLSDYCVDAAPATLTGSPSGGTFSGTGITGNIFNPSIAGPGTYTITYTYIDSHTCTNSTSQTVNVHALPMIGLLGLDNSYCIDNPPASLIGLPFGGTFTGPGMSGNIFNPGIAGLGTHYITYTYTDINGCTNFNTQMTDVYDLPVVSFTGLQSPYCTYSSPEALTGTPPGGTFSGPGIIGNTFYPNIAGIGTFNIVYSFTDGNSCLNHDTQTVVVNAQPIVSFSGLNSAYCIDAPSATLTGLPAGGAFSGPGISGTVFNPSAAGAGTHTITYFYTNSNGCYGSTSQIVIVNPLPVVFFSGLSAAYCVDASIAILSGSPTGGYFTGQGMMGNIFDPSVAGAGIDTITYHYTDGNLCYNTYSQTVIVNPLPIVTFTGLDPHYCPYEVGLLQGVPSGGTFTGSGMVYNLFYASISGVGTHDIVYTYIDGNNCLNTDTQTTVVSALMPVNIFGLASDYCVDDLPVPLTGNPAGGTFTGPGMYGNIFYPDSAGVGNHTIFYASADSLGCINNVQENVIVHGLPFVDFYGLDSAYCVDGLPSLLTGIPSGGTYSGAGISGNYFYPDSAGTGVFTITYTYADNFTCVNFKTRIVIVNPLPVVNITNLQPSYCHNNPPIALSGTPTGGTFSGTGVLGGYFYPVVSGVGTFNVTYTYTDSNSCINSHTQAVEILPVPVITSTDTVFTCSGQNVNYNITSSLAGTSYAWTSSLILGSASGYNSGSGNIINNILINNTLSAALVKYVITPTSSSTPACTGDPFVLIVNVRPYPTLFAGNDAQICSNIPYTVSDATTDPTNIINWTTSGIGTFNDSSLMHPTYTPSTSEFGNISLYMTVTNLLGCPKTDTMVLIIDYAPIANAGGNQIINCSDSVTLGSTFFPNYVYNWSPTTGLSNPNIAQPIANPITNTTYILTVTDTINGCFDVDTAIVTINGAPFAYAGADSSINCGGTGITIGSIALNNMGYNWSPAAGLDNPNIAMPTATPLSNTTYTVTVTDLITGCYNTDDITITVNGAPTANAGPDQSVNCGNSVGIVIGSPAVSGMSYNWLPTTGLSNPNVAQPLAHPLSNTTYVLTVTNTITGCFATDDMTIMVIGAPSANAGFDQSISCGSGTGAIIGTSTVSGLSYNWLPSNGLSDPNIAQPTATPLTSTTYHLIVTDLLTGCYATDEVVVTDVGMPVANAGIDQSMNCGGTGLQIGTTGVGGMSYSWSPSNTLSDPNIAQPIATPSGNTTYVLTVTDLLTGCYNTDNVTITVIGAPVAAAGLDQSVNCGSGTTIGSLAVANMSYTWIPSLGLNNPNISQPTATPHTNTNYTLIVTNTITGCYATDDVSITVIGTPLADAGPNQTINCGGPGTIIGTSSVSGMSYTWAPSYALSASNTAQPTATPLGNTTYYLTVTDISTGCYGVDSVTITVAGAPIANAGVDQTISCGGLGANIGTPGLSGYSYSWSPPNGLNNPNSPTPIATPLGNTTYLLTVTDTLTGCFGTDQVSIHVSGTPTANAGLNQAIPCGGPGVLIGTQGSAGVNYSWSPSYGLNNSNINMPLATPYITTIYVLTATDSLTGCFATDNVLVTVVGLPSVYAGSDGFVCANDTFMITNATSSNSFVHWTYNGIGTLTNNTTLSPTYFPLPNEFGSVIITLTAVCNIDTATDNMTLTIYPYPVATFSALDSSYCIDNPGNMLIGYPSGGTFTGAGITGDFFSPASAGVGTHQITYTYQDANGCIKDTSQITIVNPLPVVSFTGLANHYCAYDAAYLTGTPAGGTFSGMGMVGNMFYASISGVGTFSITYTYLDSNGCINSQTQQTIVTAIPSVNFSGLAPEYCIDASPVTLSGTPAGGTFTGPGIENDTIFNPALAGPGSHNIDYAYIDTSSCISNATHTVIVYDLPNVTFSGLDSAYCIDATPVVLSGFPAGGTFSGQGISDSTFNPSVAGSGVHAITYTFTDIHGCTNFIIENVKVNPLPIVTLSQLNDVCIDLAPFTLYGGLPAGGTYTGTGVVNNIFYPTLAGIGTFQITYTYTDSLGCVDFDTKAINVNPLPIVSFIGLGTYYCIGNDSIILTGTPSGGIFTGPGIVGNIFNPMLAGVGFHNITYTFTDTNSCTSSQSQLVEVKALPIVNFSGLDTAYCIDAPIAQLIGYPTGGAFTGSGINGTTFNPSMAGAGQHIITYTYIDSYLCVDSTAQSVVVHALPVVTLTPLGDVCPNYPAFLLTGGSPLGGTYSGAGVDTNIFYPNIAGVGTHNITYTYTDIYTCVNFFMQTLTVNPLPVLTINGLDSLYCFNAPSDTLTGLPVGGYFIGAGISGNAFNPAIAGVGTHNIGYVYTDSSSCTDTLYQPVKVLPLPQLAFSGLDSAYCVNNPPDSLYGFPIGGTFFGSGITTNNFDPSLAGVGTHSISYTYTDINVCTDTISFNVVVHDLPVVTFGILAPLCVDALPITLNTGLPLGGIYSGPGVSGGQFNPTIAGVGTHTLTYQYSDINNCVNFATQTITVNPLPVVSITNLNPYYCVNDVGDTITGIPAGGTFSGIGMNNNVFDPTIAGVGSHLITYTYTDSNSCTNSFSQNTDVKSLPILSISGLDTSYCINSAPVYISGTPPGGTFTGTGISGNMFDPVAAGIGIYPIVYTYSDFYGCTNKDTIIVVVNALTMLSIIPVSPVCIDETPFLLQCVLPAGGTYSGQGVVSGIFYPQTAGAGPHTIYYDYLDNNNCMVSTSTIITVNPLPVVTLTLPLYEMCSNDTLLPLTGGTPIGGTYSGAGITGSVFDPYIAGAGYHVITYTFTDSNTCTSSAQAFINVNQAPLADAGENASICANTSVTLKATGGDFYVWNTNETTPEIVVSPVQTYTYTVTVSDAFNGCSEIDSVTVNIIPLPVVVLVTDAEGSVLTYGQYITFTAVPSSYNYYDFYMNTALAQSGPLGYYATNMVTSDTMITVIALDGNCISEPYNLKLNVKPISNAFTPNGDGKNDVYMKGYDLSIMNRWGQLLYEGYDGWDGNFNGIEMPEGTYYYIIRFKDTSGNISVTKGSVTLYRTKN